MYVPLAALGHSPENWDYVHSIPAFFRLLFRTDYGGITAQGGGAAVGGNVFTRTVYLARGFGIVVGVFSLLGMVFAYRRLRWYFWFSLLAIAVSGFGFMLTTSLDPTNSIDLFVLERFFLLPLVLAAPLVGLGVTWLGQIINDIWPSLEHSERSWGRPSLRLWYPLSSLASICRPWTFAMTTWQETTARCS